MSKPDKIKYPMLVLRVTQDQYDKAYRLGWPTWAKNQINNAVEINSNVKQENASDQNN